MSYIGQGLGQGQAERFLYTATGTGTAVTADDDGVPIGYTVGQVSVYLNGVKQVIGSGKDVTATDGSTITFLAAYAADDVIEVIALSTFSPADTVPATGGTFTGNVTHSGDLRSGTLKAADGTAAITVANSTGKVTFAGDFQIDGTTTTVNSTTLTIDDKNIELAHSPSGSEGDDAAVDGGGITLKSSDSDKTILWENDTDSWNFSENIETLTNKKIIQRGEAYMKTLHNSWVMGG